MNEAKTINVIVKSGGKDISKALKKVKGLKGGLIALTIFCGYLAAELAERKRSENYLKGEIDELKEHIENDILPKLKTDGGDADA